MPNHCLNVPYFNLVYSADVINNSHLGYSWMYNFHHNGLFFRFHLLFSALVFHLPFVAEMTVLTQRDRKNEKIDKNIFTATCSSEIIVVLSKCLIKRRVAVNTVMEQK